VLHSLVLLREDLRRKRFVTRDKAMYARNGKLLVIAGPVLVRQKPGSAKGVMFITVEDETGIVHRVIWPKLYEKQRRIVNLGSIFSDAAERCLRRGDRGFTKLRSSTYSYRNPSSSRGVKPLTLVLISD